MSNWKQTFAQTSFRFIDHSKSNQQHTALDAFAIDDALALSVGTGASPSTVRVWTHDQTVVLGISDARLPYIADGVNWLQQQGYQSVVRNSGGLAVVLDKGVLNISLLLTGAESIGIHQGYQIMVAFIKEIFSNDTTAIEAYEVTGSYCPGDYDLSINGQKFAGISQRRIRNGMAVQIYLSIEADHQARARLIKGFYQRGLRGESGKYTYPTIEPDTMEALATILNKPLTVDTVIEKIQQHLLTLTNQLVFNDLTEDEQAIYQKRRQQMIDRNKKALGNLFY